MCTSVFTNTCTCLPQYIGDIFKWLQEIHKRLLWLCETDGFTKLLEIIIGKPRLVKVVVPRKGGGGRDTGKKKLEGKRWNLSSWYRRPSGYGTGSHLLTCTYPWVFPTDTNHPSEREALPARKDKRQLGDLRAQTIMLYLYDDTRLVRELIEKGLRVLRTSCSCVLYSKPLVVCRTRPCPPYRRRMRARMKEHSSGGRWPGVWQSRSQIFAYSRDETTPINIRFPSQSTPTCMWPHPKPQCRW